MNLSKTIKQIIISIAFTSLCICGYSQPNEPIKAIQQIENLSSEEFLIHFKISSSLVQLDYKANKAAFEKLNTIFKDPTLLNGIDSIVITAASSPDGQVKWNERLAMNRARSLEAFLKKRFPKIPAKKIIVRSIGEDWVSLKRFVEEDSNVPVWEKVVSLLSTTTDFETKKKDLKVLNGGAPYRYITKNISPSLRAARGNISFYMSNRLAKREEKELCTDLEALTPVLVKSFATNEISVVKEIPATKEINQTTEISQTKEIPAIKEINLTQTTPINWIRKPLFAVKTNLLFDAVSMLNIELEIPIGQRWSVAGEWIFPWWLSENRQYCLELLSGTVEGRYWFGDRSKHDQLTGWFGGLYAGGGLYDLEWGTEGMQGEFYIAAGLSAGYAHSISRNLRMEYSLGLGYMGTDYRRYIPRNNGEQLVWQNDGRYTWIGPTRLKVSLVWMIHGDVKEKGRRSR